ncbi:MAG: TonB-dependent receptor [Balneolaceae bacterium]
MKWYYKSEIKADWRWAKMICLLSVISLIVLPGLSEAAQVDGVHRYFSATSALFSKIRRDNALPPSLRKEVSVDYIDKTLKEALTDIAGRGGFHLSYGDQLVPLEKKINLHLENVTINDVLWKILDGTGLRYALSPNKHLILMKRYAAPERKKETVTGTVTEAATGETLPGVNIIVKGTNIGTSTNGEGDFELNVPSLQDTLVFSFIGFKKQVVPINGRTNINIMMSAQALTGEEVVVVGYGTQQRKDLTGSLTSVSGDEVSSQPVPSVSDALQGKAAGVRVISSGVPGNDATFRVRGTSTIGNSNPLVVIDGFPTNAGLNQLNPSDIESIEVLKDASAAAIYGSRGANGVVIVTTKSGAGGKSQLNVDVYRGYQQVTSTVDMLGASQFARLHNEMMQNNGLQENPDFSDPTSLGSGTDWLGRLFEIAPTQSYSVSYSGGNEKSNFYVSGNILDQSGVVTETGYKRYTLQLNTDTRLYDWLKFGNNLTLNHDVKTSGNYDIRHTMSALPTQPVFNSDGTYAGPQGRSSWVGDIVNPIGQAKLIDNSTNGYNVIGSVYGELDITDHLSFKSKLGLKANFWNSRTWSPQYDWQPNPQAESYLYEQYNKNINWLIDNTLTYDQRFNDIHHLKVLVGTSAQENNFDFINGSVKGFSSEHTQQLTNGIEQPTLDGNGSSWSLLSFMGRVNYSYKDTYLLTATLRRDGSSRFGDGNKWGFFPSGSLAWRISNEDFFHIDFVNDLKLRVGYGLTGNQEIGNYTFASALQTMEYNFGGSLVNSVVPNIMPNPNVQWETVEQYNLGVDASLLDNRIDVTVDAYVKNTKDMLVPMSVPVTTGYSDIAVPEINAGEIQNKGAELTVSTKNLQGEFSWNTDFNISYNQNKVVSLNDTIPLPSGNIDFNYNVARIEADHPVNAFYGYVTNGIFQTQQEVDNYAVQVPGADPFNRTSPGDIKFVDLNNDGVIDDNDRTYIGDPNPDFTFALNNSFAYRHFDLSIALQGVAGNEIFNANRIWSEGMSSARNQTTATANRWTGEGTSNTMPRAVYSDPNGNTRASDRYIEDGSYLRIKTVTLGYTVPARLTEKMHVSHARLYITGQNVWTFTKYKGFDPEVPVNGIDNNVYPVTRTISLGINLSF